MDITYNNESKHIGDIERLNNTFAKGGEEELNEAIRIYGQRLLKYCHNILCDYYDAEEVVQITFLKAYEKRKNFKEGSSLSSWLYRIAYTTCIDYIRKKKFQMIFNKDIKERWHINQEKYMSDELREALMKISPRERALIFSRVLDEKDYSELEVIYKASAQTLRKRYERAKKKLANILRESNITY